MYDIKIGKEKQITTMPSGSPSIFGNKIVWVDNRNGKSDIYMFDLTTGNETKIATGESNQLAPSISGDKTTKVAG